MCDKRLLRTLLGQLIWPFNKEKLDKNKQLPLTQGHNLIWCREAETRLSISESFGGNWFQLSTPTSGRAHRAWKEINGKGFNRLTIIGLILSNHCGLWKFCKYQQRITIWAKIACVCLDVAHWFFLLYYLFILCFVHASEDPARWKQQIEKRCGIKI